MKRKCLMVLLATILTFSLVGCGGTSDEVVVSETETSSEDETVEEEVAETVSAVGKRSNPVPLGETATFSNNYYSSESDTIEATMSITLSNVVRGEEAYNYLLDANEWNDQAPEGFEWVLIDFSFSLDEGSDDDAYSLMDCFKVVSDSGAEVEQTVYGTLSDGESIGFRDIYKGGTYTGKIAKIVPVEEDFLLEFVDWNASVFFDVK